MVKEGQGTAHDAVGWEDGGGGAGGRAKSSNPHPRAESTRDTPMSRREDDPGRVREVSRRLAGVDARKATLEGLTASSSSSPRPEL